MPKINQNVANDAAATVAPATKPARISLAPAAPEVARSIMAELRSDPNALGLVRVNGEICLDVKIPGMAALPLTRQDLRDLHARSVRPVAEGSTPAAVFERSFSDDSTGGFSARFSDAPRARTLEISGAERSDWCDFLAENIGNFDKYEALVIDAETKANTPADNSPK